MTHATLVLNQLWKLLIRTSVQAYPDQKKSIMVTHASDGGLGTVLSRGEVSGEIMGWYSCSLSCGKIKLRNFYLTRPKLLVVVHAVKHFRMCLFNHQIS